MKYPTPILIFFTALISLVSSLSAQTPGDASLKVARNSMQIDWSPLENVQLNCQFGIIELKPHDDPAKPPVWRSPVNRPGFDSPAAEGDQVTIPFDKVWSFSPEAPGITGTRVAEYMALRLVIRDSWELAAPKTNATVNHEFTFSLNNYPDIELDLIEPDPEYTVLNPRLQENLDHIHKMFSRGILIKAKGFVIKNIAGGEMHIRTSETRLVSPQFDKSKNTIRFRFMPVEATAQIMSKMDNGLMLPSGESIFILDWVANPTSAN